MMKNKQFTLLGIGCFLFIMFSCQEERIDFNTQVRPIFNEHCVSCHGGVKRSGGFGLVFRENAVKKTKNDKWGIVPGNPAKSELYRRITAHDRETRMPLEEDPLQPAEIELIEKWIEQGAEWEEHWAYILPKEPKIPAISSSWIQNEIDPFILEKIEQQGLKPAPAAEPTALVRRVYLDLTGLPPTAQQVDDFLQNTSPTAYENLVDTLLAAASYGEHWASFWLDLARYADSFGYSSDRPRVIWKYRDWVIKALNQDMPFDQFTVEQLAGDLLPNPSADQLLATAFHRACLTNTEGGANLEESRNVAVIDRVNTTWEAWQGTTMACVQCHNHPYDPIKQTDFYSSFAFFNNTNDHTLMQDYPIYREFKEEDEKKLDSIKQWISSHSSSALSNEVEAIVRTHEPKIVPFDFQETVHTKFYNRTGDDFMSVYDSSSLKLGHIDLPNKDRLFLNYSKRKDLEGTINIHVNAPSGKIIGTAKVPHTGWGLKVLSIPIESQKEAADVYVSFSSAESEFEIFIEGFVFGKELPGKEKEGYLAVSDRLDELMKAGPTVTTPIMVERPASMRRKTQVFERGNWMMKGEEVAPGVAAIFESDKEAFKTRLDLAKWLVSEKNPLTARVLVNRIWAQLFGRGIVPTLEDFGSMGEPPTHPALLDWLALRFSQEQNWQFKKLIKSIVLSATYQQSAKVATETLEKDPDNLWLARSPRTRLSAEQVRDQALLVSGLLSKKMYGPGVMPVQPEGIWKISFSNDKWITSTGEDLYRRAIYTYIKRSALYPSFLTFDASGREVCLSRRISTNTPLQALVTLNDPVYFEAARALASTVMLMEKESKARLSKAYRLLMGKSPTAQKMNVLENLYEETTAYYEANPKEVQAMLQSDNRELAVLSVVANSLMNMDEFITK